MLTRDCLTIPLVPRSPRCRHVWARVLAAVPMDVAKRQDCGDGRRAGSRSPHHRQGRGARDARLPFGRRSCTCGIGVNSLVRTCRSQGAKKAGTYNEAEASAYHEAIRSKYAPFNTPTAYPQEPLSHALHFDALVVTPSLMRHRCAPATKESHCKPIALSWVERRRLLCQVRRRVTGVFCDSTALGRRHHRADADARCPHPRAGYVCQRSHPLDHDWSLPHVRGISTQPWPTITFQ